MTETQTSNLKFCLLNAENLFLMFDHPVTKDFLKMTEKEWQNQSSSIYENKPLKKCEDLAKALREINADVILLCEVGGQESLENFNTLFLDSQYSACLIEGNSDRNIDVAFLIRKDLPFFFDLESNKNRLINYLYPHERQSLEHGFQIKGGKITSSHKFSRDVVELRLFKKDRNSPFLITLLTHLKSRLDPERIDPNGFERRQAELRTLLEIYKEIESQNPNTPIIIAGDFNGNASKQNTDEEFLDIYSTTDLVDIFDLANLTTEERATFYQVKSGSRTDGRQIDFVFASPQAKDKLDNTFTGVFRYKDEIHDEIGIPYTMEAKQRLPSDHYPIVFSLKFLTFI